jgi:tRNA pseudouridine38-40 synthase
MSVVRLDVAYDGTNFRGWARQPHVRTVEGEITAALGLALGELPQLRAAGRTDAGVHARGQVVSFTVARGVDPQRLLWAANGILAPEVVVTRATLAPEGFDARLMARSREYRYRIDTGPVPDPFTAAFVLHWSGKLSLAAMREAARGLAGKHDFSSFGRPLTQGGGTIRDVRRLTVARSGERIEIAVRANSFLRQMVRSLVGTLVDVGRGRIEPDDIPAIIEARDRSRAGKMAPARGLTLERVSYR